MQRIVSYAFILILCSVVLVGISHVRMVQTYHSDFRSAWGNALRLSVGTDLNTCVLRRTLKLLNGEPIRFKSVVQSACGYTFPVLFAFLFPKLEAQDGFSVYTRYLLIIGIGYLILFAFIIRQLASKDRILVTLCIVGFLLGIPAAHGIYAGNVDVALALVFGFYVLTLLRLQQQKTLAHWPLTFLLGVMGGLMAQAKLFLLPLTLFPLLFLQFPWVPILGFFTSFVGITYAPRLFGSGSSMVDFIQVVLFWGKNMQIKDLLGINFSIAALATMGTGCVIRQDCDWAVRPVLHLGLEIGTFVLGLWPLISLRDKLTNGVRWVRTLRSSREGVFLTLVVAAAGVSLLPKIVYGYRLYFTFVLLLLSYGLAKSEKRLLANWILSAVFLVLSGIWLLKYSREEIFWLFDARVVNVFVIGHFLFLMKLHAHGFISRVVSSPAPRSKGMRP